MSATASEAQNELAGTWERKSKGPGFVRVTAKGYGGRVYGERTPLVVCHKCGGRRLKLEGPHAPRLEHRGGRWVELDCAGDLVSL